MAPPHTDYVIISKLKRWSHEASVVPFFSKKGKNDAGGGELRYCKQIGGKLMKGLISYDVCKGKKRIDVKSFDHPSGGVRLGIEGKRAIKSFVRGVEDVVDEADDLVNSFMTDAEDRRAREAGVDMDLVRYFLMKRNHTSDCGEMPKGFIFGGTKKYPFGVAQLIREVRNIVKAIPRAKKIVKHKMFFNPSMLKKQFSDKMIEDVFCRCDSVAFVNDELGYLEVPSRDVKKYVSPARITQGTLNLKFKIR